MIFLILSFCLPLNNVLLAENVLLVENKVVESKLNTEEVLEETQYKNLIKHLDKIKQYEKSNDYKNAIDYIKELDVELQNNLKVQIKLADLKLKIENYDKAFNIFEKIVNNKNFSKEKSYAIRNYKMILKKKIELGESSAYLPLMKILKTEWRNQEALNYLQSALSKQNVSVDIKNQLLFEEAIFHLRLGNFEEAIARFENYSNTGGLQWLSQAYYRKGDFEKAAEYRLKAYNFTKSKKDSFYAFEILAKGGKYKAAKELLQKYPNIKSVKTTWLLSLSSFLSEDYAAAIEHCDVIIKLVEEKKLKSEYYESALYYKARSLELTNKKDSAIAIYEKLANGKINYYQILASFNLNSEVNNEALHAEFLNLVTAHNDYDHLSLGYKLWLKAKVDFVLDKDSDNIKTLNKYLKINNNQFVNEYKSKKAIYEFSLRGDWENAYEELSYNKEKFLEVGFLSSLTKDEALIFKKLAVKISARNKDYRLAVRFLSLLKDNNYSGSALATWSYPLIYGKELKKVYEDYNIAPQLLLSLIRTESAFQDDVVSFSNARGLMQVLPSTGLKIAESLGHKTYNEMDLFEASFCINYGAWYLSALIEAFDEPVLALAAYNGGPFNVKSLIIAKEGVPLDIFIDTLIFQENINYVKRITEVQYVYEKLYLSGVTKKDFTKKIKLPKDTLPSF